MLSGVTLTGCTLILEKWYPEHLGFWFSWVLFLSYNGVLSCHVNRKPQRGDLRTQSALDIFGSQSSLCSQLSLLWGVLCYMKVDFVILEMGFCYLIELYFIKEPHVTMLSFFQHYKMSSFLLHFSL